VKFFFGPVLSRTNRLMASQNNKLRKGFQKSQFVFISRSIFDAPAKSRSLFFAGIASYYFIEQKSRSYNNYFIDFSSGSLAD